MTTIIHTLVTISTSYTGLLYLDYNNTFISYQDLFVNLYLYLDYNIRVTLDTSEYMIES